MLPKGLFRSASLSVMELLLLLCDAPPAVGDEEERPRAAGLQMGRLDEELDEEFDEEPEPVELRCWRD